MGKRCAVLMAAMSAAGWIAVLSGCSPGIAEAAAAAGDLRPPAVVSAGPKGVSAFAVTFDEEVTPVDGSYFLDSGTGGESIRVSGKTEGAELEIAFPAALVAGASYKAAGEARDRAGNVTRFLFSFAGWNAEPVRLVLNEAQFGKNSSTVNPHRDYLEFIADDAGNLGGVQVEWASASKDYTYRFPAARVAKGAVVVLHCSPEGLPAEKDETGTDISLSGGVDSSATGRDFWFAEGGLPDESGLVLARLRPGEPPVDGLFYADVDKTGPVEQPRIAARLAELAAAGLWEAPSSAWGEAFIWKPSTSRPLHRQGIGMKGKSGWAVGESGTQSPGEPAPAQLAARSAKPAKKRLRVRRDP